MEANELRSPAVRGADPNSEFRPGTSPNGCGFIELPDGQPAELTLAVTGGSERLDSDRQGRGSALDCSRPLPLFSGACSGQGRAAFL